MMKRFLTLLVVLALPALAHGQLVLRQSTASQAVMVGPFVDSTDGNTAETGLTIDAADVRLSKNGGNIAAKNSGGCTHDELGYYTCTLDATDTDTVGRLQLMVHESGALPVYHEFQVLEESVYDATYASGATGRDGVIHYGTAQSATSTTLVLASSAGFADDELVGATIVITGGTGIGQSRRIKDYVGSTDTATVDAWATTPSGTITYEIYATSPSDDLWATALPGSYSEGTAGYILGTNVDATVSSRASQTSVDTIDDYVDSEVAAILSAVGTPSDLGSGATLAANLVDIEAQTDDIGAAGAGLTDIPWNADWDAEVQSEAADALNEYDPPTNAEMVARTLASASYATATALATVDQNVDDIEAFLDDLADGSASFLGCTFTIDSSPGDGEFYINVSSCTAP